MAAIVSLTQGSQSSDDHNAADEQAQQQQRRQDGSMGQRSAKGKTKAHQVSGVEQNALGLGMPGAAQTKLRAAWRTVSPFGAPVMQREASTHRDIASLGSVPIPEMVLPQGKPASHFTASADLGAERVAASNRGKDHARTAAFEDVDAFDVIQGCWQDADKSSQSQDALWSNAQAQLGAPFSPGDAHSSHNEPALPGDDPRFALWAVRSHFDNETLLLSTRFGDTGGVPRRPVTRSPAARTGADTRGHQRKSLAPGSASSEKGSRRAKGQSENGTESDGEGQHSMLFPSDGAFLIAASSFYLVAELTSHIDNRLMTDFFYTYRTFISSSELFRLLTLRFTWSCAPAKDEADEARRKIVRVRTYVVLKYWLSHFFSLDFVPDTRLREDMAAWLDNASSDQTLAGVGGIIKSLIRLVLSLKASHERGCFIDSSMPATNDPSAMRSTEPGHIDDAAAAANSQVDLRLSDDNEIGARASEDHLRSPRAEKQRSAASKTPKMDAKRSATSYGMSNSPAPQSLSSRAAPPLPSSHNAFSRAVVSTFSRFSRIKRHLPTRGTSNPFASESSDGLEPDVKDCHDLLYIRGGVEDFLDFFELQPKAEQHASIAASHSRSSGDESHDPVSDATTAQDETPSIGSHLSHSTPASSIDLGIATPHESNSSKAAFGLGISDIRDSEEEHSQPLSPHRKDESKASQNDMLHHFQSDQTLRTASQTKQMSPMRISLTSAERSAEAQEPSTAQPLRNIVQIDDVDLSSDEDDGMVRRALRRLPGARDLRLANTVRKIETPVRQSFDSMASIGRTHGEPIHTFSSSSRPESTSALSAPSMTSAVMKAASAGGSSRPVTTVTSEMLDPDEALRGYELVKGFRLDHLDASDEEEVGDVEAALRRLEGVIDQDKQRERQKRVEAMWLRSQDTQKDEKKGAPSGTDTSGAIGAAAEPNGSSDAPERLQIVPTSEEEHESAESADVSDNNPSQGAHLTTSETITDLRSAHLQASKGDVLQAEAPGHAKFANQADNFATHNIPRYLHMPPPLHRSFLLDYHSEMIAQQFSIVEVELFRAVSWQELTSDLWKNKQHPGQVLDWQAFYQHRARSRVDAQAKGSVESPESGVEAIVARFNLTCNWVASEIVLTGTVEARAAVMRKLIRIAWKCYHLSNYATLTQIILGLQSPWVERLTRSWQRVGLLEMRMLRDLKAFINPARNFKHLRNAMRKMLVQGRMEDLVTSAGPPLASTQQSPGMTHTHESIHFKDGCIPFFGLFLADMALYDALPTLIDPSAPEMPPAAASATEELTALADAGAIAHLTALPRGMKMLPLVNLYKYRILAMTVKSVLALQERLDAFSYPIERTVYVKALKLRCLEAEHLTTISRMAEP